MTQRTLSSLRHAGVVFLALVLLTLAVTFSPPVEAQSTSALTLTVHVTGARNTKGKIRAALFQDAKGFPGDASQAVQTHASDIDPQALSAEIVFTGLHEGISAVTLFHDENMNQKLDKNFMGLPKEGYGASNNPKRKMGPPDFEVTKFQLKETGQSVEIKLIY
jgi:uncharacterized protein (DUF2141 family)